MRELSKVPQAIPQWMIAVLLPVLCVPAGPLPMTVGILADPHVRPCRRNGKFLYWPRLYWTEWADGTIIGDPTRGYSGDNPLVSIRKA